MPPTPYLDRDGLTLYQGDCRQVLAQLPEASVDAVVTDPPYDLTAGAGSGGGFMSEAWDATGIAFDAVFWAEVLRVLKPGGHLLAFGGTRTYHHMVCATEAAGFQTRDSLHWVFGGGMPKSLDVSKAIDRAGGVSPRAQAEWLRAQRQKAGMTREQLAEAIGGGCTPASVRDWEEGRARAKGKPVEWLVPSPRYRRRLTELFGYTPDQRTVVATDKTDRRGDGTVLGLGHSGLEYRPGATPAGARWLGWGTSLKPSHEPVLVARKPLAEGTVAANVLAYGTGAMNVGAAPPAAAGHGDRWPANFILAHADHCVQDGASTICADDCPVRAMDAHGHKAGVGASRFFVVLPPEQPFFYCAKAGRKERDAGQVKNTHPTVKPLKLLAYLARLVTPPGGLVLDPFVGSGSTALACAEGGFRCVGIDQEAAYLEIARARVEHRAGGGRAAA